MQLSKVFTVVGSQAEGESTAPKCSGASAVGEAWGCADARQFGAGWQSFPVTAIDLDYFLNRGRAGGYPAPR
jgi:hypothetical protein